MTIHPCKYCTYEKDCTKSKMIRRKVKQVSGGIYILPKINIRCTMYYSQFQKGDRVTFNFISDIEGSGSSGWEYFDDCIDGTVIRWSGRKVIVYLDEPVEIYRWRDEKQKIQIISMYPKKDGWGQNQQYMYKNEQTQRHVCEMCDRPAFHANPENCKEFLSKEWNQFPDAPIIVRDDDW